MSVVLQPIAPGHVIPELAVKPRRRSRPARRHRRPAKGSRKRSLAIALTVPRDCIKVKLAGPKDQKMTKPRPSGEQVIRCFLERASESQGLGEAVTLVNRTSDEPLLAALGLVILGQIAHLEEGFASTDTPTHRVRLGLLVICEARLNGVDGLSAVARCVPQSCWTSHSSALLTLTTFYFASGSPIMSQLASLMVFGTETVDMFEDTPTAICSSHPSSYRAHIKKLRKHAP